MQFIFIGIGTGLSILFMIQLKIGEKYDAIVETLDSNQFPLNA